MNIVSYYAIKLVSHLTYSLKRSSLAHNSNYNLDSRFQYFTQVLASKNKYVFILTFPQFMKAKLNLQNFTNKDDNVIPNKRTKTSF